VVTPFCSNKNTVKLKSTFIIFLVITFCICSQISADEGKLVTMIAVGDVMLSRGVGNRIAQFGPEFPFAPTAHLLQSCDVAFANLESPISMLGKPMERKEVLFRAAPKSVLGLMYAGIDVVSLGNNHALDYGEDALFETMDILAKNRISYTGVGMNGKAAHRPANIAIKNTKISFLAYSANFYLTVEAAEGKAGVAVIRKEQLKADIKKAKEWADIVVVSFHWGWEYSNHPTDRDKEIAHLVIDAGADLVIGHHPHVIQGVETYNGGLICYSLGNFIFDQDNEITHRGLILRCAFSKGGIKEAELLPIQIDPKEFRPRLASNETRQSILEEVKKLSADLGTKLQLKDNLAVVVIPDFKMALK